MILKYATREMSIAFHNHTDISSRHLNPYVRYETSLKVDAVFKPPILLVQKQSCDAVEEACNEFAQVEENVQASDVISSGEDVALLIPQRNSIISSASPTKVAKDLESRKPSLQETGSNGTIFTESDQYDDSESTTVNTTLSTANKTKNIDSRINSDATTVSSHILAQKRKGSASDSTVANGFVRVHLEGFSHFFPHNLHTLHRRQLFCDVTVRAHNKDIQAHKVVLAACSPYLYRVLENDQDVDNTSRTVSDYHRVIDLGTSVTASALQFVVECMYTSAISLSEDTVEDTLQASSYLDMQLVVQACLEFMEKWKTDDVTRKQYIDDRRDRYSSEESVTDLEVITKETRRQEETNPACSSVATTSVLAESLYDTKGDAIYQSVSRQELLENDSGSQHAKSTDHKAVSPNDAKERLVESTSSIVDTHSHLASQTICATDSDDDVFVKKESSPSVGQLSSDSGLHDSAGSTPSTPGTHDAIAAAEVLRRRQSEFYRHVLANNPYLLNPEAMAAAVAMASLTPPLRSLSNQTRFSVPSAEQSHLLMNPAWHHIFGHSLQPVLHSNAMHRHPGHVTTLHGGLQPSQYMDILQQQRMRQHAILNLSGSAPKPSAVDNKVPNRYSPKRRGSVISPPYSPLMLSSLLQNTHDLPCSRSLKRSLSANSVDHQTLALDKPSIGRFLRDKSTFSPTGEGQSFSPESTTTDCQPRPPKRRRSTNGRSGSPDRPYKCMVCAAEFNRPANLKTHMRIHSGEKPYKCQSCGARFVQVAHLRAHILIHTGEKPYPCKVCGTRFRHLQTLKSHFRIHTGEKPYACEECQVKFRHKSQLRLHLRTKHGINTNTKKTYQQVPGLNSADISAHIKRTQEAVRMQSSRREF